MFYFNTLPKVLVTKSDGTSALYTNLMARTSLLDNILTNPLLYYSYDIQDTDTPEIVAEKYVPIDENTKLEIISDKNKFFINFFCKLFCHQNFVIEFLTETTKVSGCKNKHQRKIMGFCKL